MDIIKLRNDYLKKINKTASELNRRLSFLNEINNTISHNNMVGGSINKETKSDKGKGIQEPGQNIITSPNYGSGGVTDVNNNGTQPSTIDVDKIISANNLTITQITGLITTLKTNYNDSLSRVQRLKQENDDAAISIKELKETSDRLNELVRTLTKERDTLNNQFRDITTKQGTSSQEISRLSQENQKYLEGISILEKALKGTTNTILAQLNTNP